MKAYRLLLKLNLRTLVSNMFGGSIRKDNGKPDISKIALYIIAAIGLLVMIGGLIYMEHALYRVVTSIGQQKLLIGMTMLGSMLVTLIFGLFHTLASMYFTKDTAGMAYLPIPSRTIMAAKWTEIYVPEIFLSAAFLLPLCIMYGMDLGADPLYYLKALLITAVAPLYPLSIALLISSVLGRFTSVVKHREVWVVLGTVLMLVVVLFAETMLIPQIPDDADALYFMKLIMSQEALLNLAIGAFPPVMWAVNAIAGNWGMFLLFCAVAAAAVVLLVWILGRNYLNVVLRHTEHAASRKPASRRKQRSQMNPRSPLMAIFHRELNEALKVPVYLLNGVMGAIMMPLIMVVVYIMLSMNEETAIFMEKLREIVNGISGMDLILICTAAMSLMCWLTPLIGTAVSREGKRLQITRMIPVNAETILNAKLLMHMVINLVSAVVVAACLAYLMGVGFIPHIAVAFVLANMLSYALGAANLTVDVMRPVLEWKNETEVIKQNMNQVLGMLISTIMLAILVVPVVLMIIHGVGPVWRLVCVTAVTVLETIVGFLLIRKVASPRYAALEP